MSFKEVGWVLDHSPYKLGTRLIHIVLAERANEDNDRELWYSVPVIAAKAGVSVRTVRGALDTMTEDGYLEVIEERPGKTTRYRFVMPTHANSAGVKDCTPAIRDTKPLQSTDSVLLLPKEDKNGARTHFWASVTFGPRTRGETAESSDAASVRNAG